MAGNINPVALLFLAAMCLVILRATNKNAIRAVLLTAAFIPLGQDFYVAGLHIYFIRVLILFGLCRLVIWHETVGFRPAGVDKLVTCCLVTRFICGLLREPSAETFGHFYDDIGVYFLIRILMGNGENVLDSLRTMAYLGIAIGACMAIDSFTHRNLFSAFGGVPSVTIQRGDHFRCQGPFRHPILAGTFGATLFPLMIGLWQNAHQKKWLAIGGIVGSVIITVASASSGPLLTFLAAIVGFCLWPMRWRMRLFRWGVVAIIIGLALVMKAPVWFLIGKISDITGGGGYYRSYLIDQFIRHFSQWWLIGTSYTANWAIAGIVLPNNPNMVDITNHYIAQGVQGGILGLGFFLAAIVVCFKITGRFIRFSDASLGERKLVWALGVCLACHCTAFISVSYFDQIQVFWFWLLAVIATIPMWSVQKTEENFTSQEVGNVRVESKMGEVISCENILVQR